MTKVRLIDLKFTLFILFFEEALHLNAYLLCILIVNLILILPCQG